MRTPEPLETLVEYGIVEEVLRPLMSGKEAQIYLVRSGGELRVAKVYKDAQQRSFKQRADYTEGRTTRNTRDQRAMAKHSRHGKAQDEAAWRSAEVNAIYRLSAAGVRVPVPYHFVDGVLVMELVQDADGQPAPRLGDLVYAPEVARRIYDHLLAVVVSMLCAGVVHGDLSEFNVLMAADGPVVIDFPQAVDPASNLGARKLLLRDVDNLHRFLARYVRGGRPPPYAQEMWDLYQQNLLTPETRLRGFVRESQRPTNTSDVLALIGDAEREHRRRSGGPPGPARGPRGPGAGRDDRGPRGPKVEVQVAGERGAQTGPRGPKVEVQIARGPGGDRGERGPRGPKVEVRVAEERRPQADSSGPRGPRVEPVREPRAEQGREPRGREAQVAGREPRGREAQVAGREPQGREAQVAGREPRGREAQVAGREPRGREAQVAGREQERGTEPTQASAGGSGAEGEAPRRRRRRRPRGGAGAGSRPSGAGTGA